MAALTSCKQRQQSARVSELVAPAFPDHAPAAISRLGPSIRFMSLLRLYTRVLDLLGKEARLGWILAGANLLLAGAQFAEPVLFGRIVDVLSGQPSAGTVLATRA